MAADLGGSCLRLNLDGARHRRHCTFIHPWRASHPLHAWSGTWPLPNPYQKDRKRDLQSVLSRASSENGHTNSPGPEPVAIPSAPVQSSALEPASSANNDTQPPQRRRMTLEQMQREARARLGDIVRQQLEADRTQQQQALQPSGGVRSSGGSSSSSSNRTSGGNVTPSSSPPFTQPRQPETQEVAATPNAHTSSPDTSSSTGLVASSTSAATAMSTTAATVMTSASAPTNEWDAMRQEWDEEWQQIRARWRQFVERPLDPPPSQQQPLDDGSAAGAATAAPAAEGSAGGHLQRRAVVSRALQLVCVAAFVAQWAPLAHALVGRGAAAATAVPGWEVWLALLVASPPTPLTLSWQADAVSLSAGHFGCLLTSSVLHSGLVSLAVSLASLEETLPWLETLDGFVIMLVSYGMAGAAVGLAQLLLGSQPSGIAGLGAAVGLEVAVAIRCWRYTRGKLMPPTITCICLLCVAVMMAVYQPLVGPWGILGGILGGALSAVLAYDILYVMRVVIAVTILLGVGAWNLLTWLPRTVWRLVVGVSVVVWGTLVAILQALRGV
ncbi:hypothetical protein Vretimale_10719 [Volvox reticuliferus]|uniref:Peptidase S54 rhomboid domain-containing protein n=1 Tax=Volvox reticuliferus TaxID=1737510 RepID=A0A8J4FPT9_9CHLO|nr:hypothetical protein Vretifemale_13838 [Volvox reticuliferus]GIM06482.1 hypothetical protein Vretimale_10719 [Volvox reticuliferus]